MKDRNALMDKVRESISKNFELICQGPKGF